MSRPAPSRRFTGRRALRQSGVAALCVALGFAAALFAALDAVAQSAAAPMSRGEKLAAATDLSLMRGFARTVETTGGEGYPTFIVSDPGDSAGKGALPPIGSLRDAVDQARRVGGGVILFQSPEDGSELVVALRHTLRLPSNVTLDGVGARATITAPEDTTALRVDGVDNVIIRRLGFTKNEGCERGVAADGRGCEKQADAISVLPPTDRIWIAQNDFTRCGDGCVDIVSLDLTARPSRITVSFNRFTDHDKVMLIGLLPCYRAKGAPAICATASEAEPLVEVTIERNVFDSTAQRHPKVVSFSYAHTVGNVLFLKPFLRKNGKLSGSYGMVAATGGRLLSEGDFIGPKDVEGRFRGVWAWEKPQEAVNDRRLGDGPGAARIQGGFATLKIVNIERAPELVPDPPYDDVPTPTFDGLDPSAALLHAACVVARAGAHPKIDPSVPCE